MAPALACHAPRSHISASPCLSNLFPVLVRVLAHLRCRPSLFSCGFSQTCIRVTEKIFAPTHALRVSFHGSRFVDTRFSLGPTHSVARVCAVLGNPLPSTLPAATAVGGLYSHSHTLSLGPTRSNSRFHSTGSTLASSMAAWLSLTPMSSSSA